MSKSSDRFQYVVNEIENKEGPACPTCGGPVEDYKPNVDNWAWHSLPITYCPICKQTFIQWNEE